jgi:ATP-dependent DNA helicase RecG
MSRERRVSGLGGLAGKEPGPMLEYLADPAARTLAETIVSFANGAGGTIIVGIDEHGDLSQDASDDLEPVLERALSLCQPPFGEGELPRWYYEQVPQGQIAAIIVRPTPYQMSLEGGQVFVRSGRTNLRLVQDGTERGRPADAQATFEDQTVAGATLNDLDDDIIEEYRQNRIRRGPRGESFTRIELLRDAGAIDTLGQPTGAGILLFGQNPQLYFPQVGAVIVRFKGTSLRESAQGSERYSRRIEVTGPAPRLVERTWQAMFDEVHQSSVTNGLTRQERYEYPLEAVREAVVNAICHRDYGLAGQRVEIRLFDDHMEITSPGRLPGHITLDNMLDEHYSRNPRLVRGLYYWGYIEELGQGIDIIVDAMRREHHPSPEFREGARSFTVSLRNEIDQIELEYGEDLNARQVLALHYVREHERISNREYHQLCPDVTTETLRLDLRDLITRGIILQVGSKRGTYYVLK